MPAITLNGLLQIPLCIAVLILAAKFCGILAGRAKMPVVLGELLAGVILGPTFLNFWGLSWFRAAAPSPISAESIFKILAEIGVVLLMFVAGLETDVQMVRSAMAPAFWAAVGGVVLPMVGGAWVCRAYGLGWRESIFVGAILSATSVTITAQTLMDLKQIRSRSGSTIMGAAVIDDVLGLLVLSLVIAVGQEMSRGGSLPWGALGMTLGRIVVCLVTIFWLGPPLTRWMLKHSARLPWKPAEVVAALILMTLLALHTEWTGGMAAITGSYLAGLFVAGTPSHQKVTQNLQPWISVFFGPLFFVSIGLDINAWQLGEEVTFFVVLLLVAIAGKVMGSGAGAFFNGFGKRDSLIIGMGMIPRGEVGLIAASIGWTAGIVTRDIYVHVVVLVLITTLITPGLLRVGFPSDTLAQAVATGAKLDNILQEAPGQVPEADDHPSDP